jgi:hypothetical protein
MEASVYRPIICPGCRSDIAHRREEDWCLTVKHCTTCGSTFVVHMPHGDHVEVRH